MNFFSPFEPEKEFKVIQSHSIWSLDIFITISSFYKVYAEMNSGMWSKAYAEMNSWMHDKLGCQRIDLEKNK